MNPVIPVPEQLLVVLIVPVSFIAAAVTAFLLHRRGRRPGMWPGSVTSPEAANPPALYDALHLAALAVLAAEGGDDAKAETDLLEAGIAADLAFPEGGPESRALGIILEAAGRIREATL